jgi:hypothetical protein
MKRTDIAAMLGRVQDSGYDDWIQEYAIKLYFYPACSALLTDEEWNDIIGKDEITVRPSKVDWVIATLGERLSDLIKSLKLPPESYPSVIIYGMVGGHDLTYHFTEKGETTISVCRPYHSDLYPGRKRYSPGVKGSKTPAGSV